MTRRRQSRYAITTNLGSCFLKIKAESWLGANNEVREFRSCGGYVYEVFKNERLQVCENLGHRGDTLTSTEDGLAGTIRDAARSCLRAEARDEARADK